MQTQQFYKENKTIILSLISRQVNKGRQESQESPVVQALKVRPVLKGYPEFRVSPEFRGLRGKPDRRAFRA
jgi:hypothetical protein